MVTNITSTSLDFDRIKEKLKTYLASQDEFKDYDFEASGLNNILDVLAYNTHFNGLIANFAINESFLNTAQLRSSAVSHAEKLGYNPRSKTSSKSSLTVNVNLSTLPARPSRIMLPSGTLFNASNDEASYNFITLENYYAEDDGTGFYTFNDSLGNPFIVVNQGEIVTKTFIVDRTSVDPIFVIPDENMDTKTVRVRVYDSPTSSNYETYTPLSEAILIDGESTFFDVKESPNGFYELNFGDGITFGKAPKVGNKIIVTYLSTDGADANGCNGFTSRQQLTINNERFSINITNQFNSSSGSDKESIESIRKLAPIQFAAQKRLVTPLDYKSMILQNYPVVRDVAVWGGEDHEPIDYGKVYISIQYKDNITDQVKEETESSITTNFTDQLSIMSIRNQFIDPVETYMELVGNFNFDPTITNKSPTTLQTLVHNYIREFFTANLNQFNAEFRRSNLLSQIDDLDPAILSSRIDVKLAQRFSPDIGVRRNYEIIFPVRLAPPDNDDYIIQSSQFLYGGSGSREALVRNKLGSDILQVVTLSNEVLLDNVGFYDYKRGKVRLNGFQPDTILGGIQYLKFVCTPLEPSVITPLRNYVLRVDPNTLFMQPIRNLSETKVNL